MLRKTLETSKFFECQVKFVDFRNTLYLVGNVVERIQR